MLTPAPNRNTDAADNTTSLSHTGDLGPGGEGASPSRQATGEYVPAPGESHPGLAGDLATAFGDRYQFEDQLGQGGFGTVYRALDRRLNRRIAMKATRAASADPDRLLREARSLAQLRHPGIVTVFDVAVAGGHCFVVSELLAGPSLADWLAAQRPSPLDAAQVVAQVADALAHAHARSIVHRDVKPSNIVLADDRRPVLVDFGLAVSDVDAAGERGVVAGTPAYMSPEQVGGRGHRPDGRTDVYSLAATLYALLAGRHPFRGRTSAEVMRQVLEDEPQPLRQLRPDVSADLEGVCLKGMAKLPGDRYTTAADFADALRRAVGLLPPLLPPLPPPPMAPVPVTAAPPASGSAVFATQRTARTERRHVTLLQCVCESTAGADDDDDPMERVAAFQAACAAEVAAHGGMPLQTAGASFLACFGYPVAHEDAPRRAVHAALGICRRAGDAVLAGVSTGPAVVTESPDAPPVVVGEATAAAAAVVAQFGHAGVTVSDATFRVIEGYFDCEPCGEVRPRGAAAAVPVYRVRGERAARNRVEAADPARLTPLVGRDREVALLRERWELAAEGVRGVILLAADPGLGKSRLVRVLRDHVARGPDAGPADSAVTGTGASAVVECYCSPYHQASPFYPVIDYFDRAYQLGREPDPAARLDRLIARLRADGVHDPEDQALFAAMLSVPAGDRLPHLTLTPERQKEKTQDALLGWLAARAEHAPVLFVVEDLHWVDPTTEELLVRYVEHGGEARVLAVFTFRPEYDPPWKGKAIQTQVALNRLTRSQVAELVRAQNGGAAVPQEVVDQLIDRTDGVPLFVEEFAKLLADGGPGAGGVGAMIPATLQDLLLARLDRMASVREVVQLGAVIGRTFSHALIRAASDLDDTVLRAELGKLVGAGLLFPKGMPPRCTYTFKHALIQDAAYQSLVKKHRQQFHRTVATALERSFPDVVETQPELLAHHYTEAGDAARGVGYWLRAGARARERSAHVEAIRHLTRGVGLLAGGPPGPDRDAEELGFRMPLAASSIAVRGYAAPEVEEHVQRARELCERLGPPSPLFHVMMILWALRFIQGRSAEAAAVSGEIMALADDKDDSYRAEAHWSATSTAWWEGDFERSLGLGRRGGELYRVEASLPHAKALQQNCGPLMASYVGWALWALGDPAAARREQDGALVLAERLAAAGDKFSLVATRWHSAFLYFHAGDVSRALPLADQVIATSEAESYAFWLALGRGLKGAALRLAGRAPEAIPLLRDGIAGCDRIGSGILHAMYLGELAEALWQVGDRAAAWEALDRGRDHNDRLGQRAFEAELHRRRATFLLDESPDNAAAAEASLSAALAVARAQKGLVFELRAAFALAKLWLTTGRAAADARQLVEGVLRALPAGAASPDLAAAQAFLASLG